MKRNTLPKFFLFAAIITFLSIVVVIAQKSYDNLMGPINSANASSLIKPISPKLNTEIVDKVELRKEYLETDVVTLPEKVVTPTP